MPPARRARPPACPAVRPQQHPPWPLTSSLQGALVVRHELSFAARMDSANATWVHDNLAKQLAASYARLDVPAIMRKASRRALEAAAAVIAALHQQTPVQQWCGSPTLDALNSAALVPLRLLPRCLLTSSGGRHCTAVSQPP